MVSPALQVELQIKRRPFTPKELKRFNEYHQEVDMVQENSVETKCPYDGGKPCSRDGNCRACPVFLDAIDKANKELKICWNCGIERAVVNKMLRDDKHSDNYWTARVILNNCSACERFFKEELNVSFNSQKVHRRQNIA